ncbi:eIF3 subunit 6 N terminal domain-containing protein [Pavlovales sp. CCMP2436]|nr:eIF3 subunit 6 N terminal domain-containing protein [Pavlovales sp. CCMP2436]
MAEVEAAPQDLTFALGGFLDRHLVFPLLEFLQEKEVYPSDQLMKAKLDLLYPTNMVDFAMDIWKGLHNTDEVPEAMAQRRQEVLERMQKLEGATAVLREVLDDAALVEHLRAEKNLTMAYLTEKHSLAPDALGALYDWARFQFECGNYGGAAECLQHFRLLSTNAESSFNALWGKLAAEILVQNWDAAMEDFTRLREAVEARAASTPPLMQLQQRSWLMHWALYVLFNYENGRATLVDFFFNERYFNALVTNCQHLLRYLVAALVLTAKRRRPLLHELTRVCAQEAANYSDPLTRFLVALNADSDFDAALLELGKCEAAMAQDFFLQQHASAFILAAKGLVFESYCKIHRRIDVGAVAAKLGMGLDDAERWIVHLVRDANLDARIDSTENHVVLSSTSTSVYQKVIEKTKGVQFRSAVLANTLEQRANEVAAKAAAAIPAA